MHKLTVSSGVACGFVSGGLLTYLVMSYFSAPDSSSLSSISSPQKKVHPSSPSSSSSPSQNTKKKKKTSPSSPKQPPPSYALEPTPRETLEPAPQETQEILSLLKSNYIESSQLSSENLSHDQLIDFLKKAADKAKISRSPQLSANATIRSLFERLPQEIGYWRLNELSDKNISKCTQSWLTWKSGNFKGLIIDLRNFADPNNFEGAANLIGLFTRPGTSLFKMEGSNFPSKIFRSERQPIEVSPTFPIVALINRDTRGSGEVLAWGLHFHAGALLVGEESAGEGGLFTETKLESGRFFRMATARITTSTQIDMLSQRQRPDISAFTDPAHEKKAFYLAYSKNIGELLPDFKPSSKTKKKKSSASEKVYDHVLARAVDVITGIEIHFQKPPAFERP